MGAEDRLAQLKLELPAAPKPVATYVTALRVGDMLYVSGHGPLRIDGTMITGKLGLDLDRAGGNGGGAGRPGLPSWPPSAAISARSITSSGWSRAWEWSTARRNSATSPR